MVDLPFITEKSANSNTITIAYSPHAIKSDFIANNRKINDKRIQLANTLYYISERKGKALEQETESMVSVRSGFFTKAEIETAQLLLQAKEVLVKITEPLQVEKSYQNFLEQVAQQYPAIMNETTSLDSWLVLLSLPFIQNQVDYQQLLQTHLNALKTMGFARVALVDHISASFFSQRHIINQENPKKPHGLLISIGIEVQIGVLISKLQTDGFIQTYGLGIESVINHASAILQDLRIHGFKSSILEQWLVEGGTCDGSAPIAKKIIRRKEFNIQPILNAPMLLFDYTGVTGRKVNGKKVEYNSIVEGVVQALKASKKAKKNINKLLDTIVITGQGAEYKGMKTMLLTQLQAHFPKKSIQITIGIQPQDAIINGLYEYLSLNSVLEPYNILTERIDPNKFKELRKSYQKEINAILKQVKSTDKKLFHPETLPDLTKSLLSSLAELAKLPKDLHTFISQELVTITKDWSKEYTKHLKVYKKQAEQGIDEAIHVLTLFTNFSGVISQLPRFLQSSFSRALSTTATDIKNIKAKQQEKLDDTRLKTLQQVFKKRFQKESYFQLEDFALATNLDVKIIIDLIPVFLTIYPNLGFLDGRIVQFQQQYLDNVGQFLNTLREDFYQALITDINKAKEFLEQINEYCDFLISGYRHQKQSHMAERFVTEKIMLTEELQNTES